VPTIQQSALTAAATYFVRLPWYVQPIWWQFRLSVTREKIMAIVYIEARPKGRGEHAPSPDTKGSSYKKESVKTRSAATMRQDRRRPVQRNSSHKKERTIF
jgi:hypothetical protein